MKKILGIVLAFVMLVTVLAIIPAASDVKQEDGYYVYLDEGITLVHLRGAIKNFPSKSVCPWASAFWCNRTKSGKGIKRSCRYIFLKEKAKVKTYGLLFFIRFLFYSLAFLFDFSARVCYLSERKPQLVFRRFKGGTAFFSNFFRRFQQKVAILFVHSAEIMIT